MKKRVVFGCASSRFAWKLRRGPFMDDEWVIIIITNSNKAVLTARPVWVTNGRRSAVIARLGSSHRMLQFRLGMDGPFRSTKQGGLSDFISHTMQFLVSSPYCTVFSSPKLHRKIACCCIRRCSLVLYDSGKSKTFNCKHDRRIANRPTEGIEALPQYHQLQVIYNSPPPCTAF